VDTGTPMGSVVFTVMATVAQMELEVTRERITDSVAKRQAGGKDLGGRRPTFTDSQTRNALRLIDSGEPAPSGRPRPRHVEGRPVPADPRTAHVVHLSVRMDLESRRQRPLRTPIAHPRTFCAPYEHERADEGAPLMCVADNVKNSSLCPVVDLLNPRRQGGSLLASVAGSSSGRDAGRRTGSDVCPAASVRAATGRRRRCRRGRR
jgi:hypothetical protein